MAGKWTKAKRVHFFVHRFKHGRQRGSAWAQESLLLFLDMTACVQAYFFSSVYGSVLCALLLCLDKSLYADRVEQELFHVYRGIAERRSQVKFIYKVLLTNKIYLKVLHISAKDTNKMQIKARWKRGKQSWRRNEAVEGGGGGRRAGEIKLSADFNINLHSACMMQEFDIFCRCVTACMFAYASVCMHVCLFLPGAYLRVQTDVLCLSRVAEVRPLHFSLVSFRSSLLSRASVVRGHVGDTCVPVAARRNQVTLQTGRHISCSCKGARRTLYALNQRFPTWGLGPLRRPQRLQGPRQDLSALRLSKLDLLM